MARGGLDIRGCHTMTAGAGCFPWNLLWRSSRRLRFRARFFGDIKTLVGPLDLRRRRRSRFRRSLWHESRTDQSGHRARSPPRVANRRCPLDQVQNVNLMVCAPIRNRNHQLEIRLYEAGASGLSQLVISANVRNAFDFLRIQGGIRCTSRRYVCSGSSTYAV